MPRSGCLPNILAARSSSIARACVPTFRLRDEALGLRRKSAMPARAKTSCAAPNFTPFPPCSFTPCVLQAREQEHTGEDTHNCMTSSHSIETEALFGDYQLDSAFDEMRERDGEVRVQYRALAETLARLPQSELQLRKQSADLAFLTQGITFTVYGRDEGTERIFPYDLLPRLITAQEWGRIERGLTQRITALNLFLRRS